ncbi:MAG: UDP-N-acetylmuramoyl-L-alanine--D-glutamate ligase, partial [Caldimonas sp.]
MKPIVDALRDRTVLVLGLGDSGLAMARWCARQGAAVRVWDSRETPPQGAALAEHVPGAVRLGPALAADDLDGVDRVLRSPGLAPSDPRTLPLLAEAAARKIAVQGELDLFAEALEALRVAADYSPKVIAVTGTNGKTTTTAMTALLVERSGKRAAAAGNIGPTMLQSLADAIDATPSSSLREWLPEVWVLELSSFQLDAAAGFDADAAALLNLTQDHLDWHGTAAAYAAAKARVFGRRAVVVVNRDDAAVMRLVPSPVAAPTRKGRPARLIERRVVTFGAGPPPHAGDYGLVIENDMAWLARARDAEEGEGRAGRAAAPAELMLQALMPADALRVRGRHNATNALAALALAGAVGCALAPMLHALREYRGEPHRVEYVDSVDGIDAFDDSKGTNVGATVAAIEGLGADRAPARLVVILGGDGKGQDFAPLTVPLRQHARFVATIGRDAAAIEAVVAAAGVAFRRFDSLDAAVVAAFEAAERGDAVLLSPACASLDMFRNYGHRADVF